MENSHSSKINYQIEKNRKFHFENKQVKKTNINILLNRVRQENRSNKKKKLFYQSLYLLFFLLLAS